MKIVKTIAFFIALFLSVYFSYITSKLMSGSTFEFILILIAGTGIFMFAALFGYSIFKEVAGHFKKS